MGVFYFLISVGANLYMESRAAPVTTTIPVTTTTSTSTVSTTNIQSIILETSYKLVQANIYIQVNFEGSMEIGSGTVIDSDEDFYYALTCAHVIDGGDLITSNIVRSFDGVESDYEVLASDEDLDLAIIKFSRTGRSEITPLEFLIENPDVSSMVISIGNPSGVVGSITIGSLLEYTTLEELDLTRNVVEHTAVISPGSSGGALTDLYGHLIGINAWILNNNYYAIPTGDILIYLQNHGLGQ